MKTENQKFITIEPSAAAFFYLMHMGPENYRRLKSRIPEAQEIYSVDLAMMNVLESTEKNRFNSMPGIDKYFFIRDNPHCFLLEGRERFEQKNSRLLHIHPEILKIHDKLQEAPKVGHIYLVDETMMELSGTAAKQLFNMYYEDWHTPNEFLPEADEYSEYKVSQNIEKWLGLNPANRMLELRTEQGPGISRLCINSTPRSFIRIKYGNKPLRCHL